MVQHFCCFCRRGADAEFSSLFYFFLFFHSVPYSVQHLLLSDPIRLSLPPWLPLYRCEAMLVCMWVCVCVCMCARALRSHIPAEKCSCRQLCLCSPVRLPQLPWWMTPCSGCLPAAGEGLQLNCTREQTRWGKSHKLWKEINKQQNTKKQLLDVPLQPQCQFIRMSKYADDRRCFV